jgi:hypothetical protein
MKTMVASRVLGALTNAKIGSDILGGEEICEVGYWGA